MTAEPSARLIRWAALGLFVLLPVLLLGLTVINLVSWGESRDLIARQEQLIGQLDARLARLGGGSGGVGDTSAIYLAAGSAPIAGAALQQRLVAAAESVGGRVIETQSVEEVEPDDQDDVRLRITLDVNNDGLRRLMHDLETGLPLITVESLAVRQQPTPANEASEDPVLRVDLGVRGFWRAST